MTLLGRTDGAGAHDGASYLELAEILMRTGEDAPGDLEQLWRRIVFSIAVSNTDDHLRDHGFLLGAMGWLLAPAYDINPNPQGAGLTLNISETDNAQDLGLALGVASVFRVSERRAREIVNDVCTVVSAWPSVATDHGLSRAAQDRMRRAFRVAEAWGKTG